MRVQGGCAIAVMAKAPRSGFCKTRLTPPLSAEQACALSKAFLRDITENLAEAARHAPITPVVAFAPAGLEYLFNGVLAHGTRLLLADGAGPMPDGVEGFGRCLLQTVQKLLAEGFESVCVLNADSPTLPTSYLIQAAHQLANPGADVVLGPAEDGGYYLLGLRAAQPRLFTDIAWSTDQVARQTRARADAAGLPLVELPMWYDVDDAAALRRMLGEVAQAGSAYPAPATAELARILDLAEQLRVAA